MSQSTKRAPINTSAQAAKDPSVQNWVGGGAPERIRQQEEEGQHELVRSDTLPTKMLDSDGRKIKEILEEAGVKFLDVVEGDPMFQYVELPEGWKKVPTDHEMWSNLVDDKGKTRASIFYKAAFYDRKAFLRLP